MHNKITDLGQYRQQKQAEQAADAMIGAAFDLLPNYQTKALQMVVSSMEQVLFYSGDVEPGQARHTSSQAGDQLIRAASTQLYTVHVLSATLISLEFDGDYIYYLHLPDYRASLLEYMLRALAAESELNQKRQELQQLKFNMAVRAAIEGDQPQQPQQPEQPEQPEQDNPITLAHRQAEQAAKDAAQAFADQHPDDFGTCGSAIVLVQLGRQRKLKAQLLQAGLITESNTWDHYGKKAYVIAFDYKVPGYNQQSADYPAAATRAYVKALGQQLPQLASLLHVHSWVD